MRATRLQYYRQSVRLVSSQITWTQAYKEIIKSTGIDFTSAPVRNYASTSSLLFAAFEAANFQIDFFGNPVMRTAQWDSTVWRKAKMPIRDLTTELESQSNMDPLDILD